MIKRVLRPITDLLGERGLIIVLLAPLLAVALTLMILPFLLNPSFQSTAEVRIQPIIGTYASFEVTTHVADFLNAFTGTTAIDAASDASGVDKSQVTTALTVTNDGGYAGAMVTFTAPTAQAATEGLRAATRSALLQIAQNNVARAKIEFDSAKASIAALMTAFDGDTFERGESRLAPADRTTARRQALTTAAERVESSQANLLAAQASVRAVETVLQSATVTTQRVSTRPDEIRASVTAPLTAFVSAFVLIVLRRRRAARLASGPGALGT